MNIERSQRIADYREKGRVTLIYGPRRIGKTTLVRKYLADIGNSSRTRYDIGDDLALQQLLGSRVRADILAHIVPYDVIAIDEAQQIPHIGIAAKMIVDAFPEKHLILTGSSSFDLAREAGEPLTGRHYVMELLPIGWEELLGSDFDRMAALEELLVYGAYPEILLAPDRVAREIKLKELVASYLFKDILALDRIKSPHLLLSILRALAWQIGNEVSLHELARAVGESSHQKVGRYVELLEKSFVIRRVGAFSTNPRKELRKPVKYYFYDLGVRNAVVESLGTLAAREGKEIGALWENFIYMEMLKRSVHARRVLDTYHFWRDKRGHEVDIVRTDGKGDILAVECKWSSRQTRLNDFLGAYPKARAVVAHRENIGTLLREWH